jgi:hypothetical protein
MIDKLDIIEAMNSYYYYFFLVYCFINAMPLWGVGIQFELAHYENLYAHPIAFMKQYISNIKNLLLILHYIIFLQLWLF